MCRRTRLTQSIALFDTYSRALVHRMLQLSAQRRGARVCHADRTQVISRHAWVLGELQCDRRDNIDKGNAMLLDEVAKMPDIEAGKNDGVDAVRKWCEDQSREAVNVEEGERREHLVACWWCVWDAGDVTLFVAAGTEVAGRAGGQLHDVGDYVVVREHDAFWLAGRARTVYEESEVFVGIDSGATKGKVGRATDPYCGPVRLSYVVANGANGDDFCAGPAESGACLFRRVQSCAVRYQDRSTAVGDLLRQLGRCIGGIGCADYTASP